MILKAITRGLNYLAEEFINLSARAKGDGWSLEAHLRLVALESLSSKIKWLVTVSLQFTFFFTFLKAAITPTKELSNDGPEEAARDGN